jgi:hypothetical protein
MPATYDGRRRRATPRPVADKPSQPSPERARYRRLGAAPGAARLGLGLWTDGPVLDTAVVLGACRLTAEGPSFHGPVPQQAHVLNLSAPAAMPATRQPTFSGALAPHSPPGRTCSASSPGSPARSARAVPAPGRRERRDSGHRTMPGSGPGYAAIALARCPLGPGGGSVENSHHPSSEGTFRVAAPETSLIHRCTEAQNLSLSAEGSGQEGS